MELLAFGCAIVTILVELLSLHTFSYRLAAVALGIALSALFSSLSLLHTLLSTSMYSLLNLLQIELGALEPFVAH